MPIRWASACNRRVSSASTRSTRSSTSTARGARSPSFPIGSDDHEERARRRLAARPPCIVTRSSASDAVSRATSSRSIAAAVFDASNASVVAAQPRAPPEHQRRVAEEERADRRRELVARAVALEAHLDPPAQREQRRGRRARSPTPSTQVARREISASRVSSSVLSCVARCWDGHGTRTTPRRRSAESVRAAIAASVVAVGPEVDGPADVAAGLADRCAPRLRAARAARRGRRRARRARAPSAGRSRARCPRARRGRRR